MRHLLSQQYLEITEQLNRDKTTRFCLSNLPGLPWFAISAAAQSIKVLHTLPALKEANLTCNQKLKAMMGLLLRS
jgi:hypothetical protein